MRVPYLSVGWNRQYLMMQEFGFVYDATVVAPLADPPFWPYTLDYKMPHKCIGIVPNLPRAPQQLDNPYKNWGKKILLATLYYCLAEL